MHNTFFFSINNISLIFDRPCYFNLTENYHSKITKKLINSHEIEMKINNFKFKINHDIRLLFIYLSRAHVGIFKGPNVRLLLGLRLLSGLRLLKLQGIVGFLFWFRPSPNSLNTINNNKKKN